MTDYTERASKAQGAAAQAFERLLQLAETRDSGQIRRVARMVAALYNGDDYPFNLFELRAVDVEISDDVLCCIDALRWGRADLYRLVPDGGRRVQAVIKAWGVAPPEPPAPPDGAELSARLVTYGHAPGYRSVMLAFDCQPSPTPDPEPKPLCIRLHIDAASAASIAGHIVDVHKSAWARGERPLDAHATERPPWWLQAATVTTETKGDAHV